MSMREKIAEIIDEAGEIDADTLFQMADAIIAALPDMIKPLKWEKLSDSCYRSKINDAYNIRVETYGGDWMVNWSAPGITDTLVDEKFSGHDAAMVAANAYHAATIMGAFE